MSSTTTRIPTEPVSARLPDSGDATPVPPSRRRYVWMAAVVGCWTINGFVSASQYYFLRASGGMDPQWGPILLTGMVSSLLWVPITFAAVWLTWRLPLGGAETARRLPVHAAAALCVPLLRAGIVFLLNPVIGWYEQMPPFWNVVLSTFLNNLFVYFMIVAAAHAFHYAHHMRQREQVADRLRAALSEAQLRALRSQLQPHFLFNTLNTISALVSYAPDAAEAMIARLSGLLRHTLERGSAHVVTLADELDFVEEYVAIEKARFEDRLHVELDVEQAARQALVPPLMLQPLVENAVRHGIAPRSEPGTVRITGVVVDGALYVQVSDNGVGMNGTQGGRGLGLSSTRERLQQMFGQRQEFTIRSSPAEGTVVAIRLPFMTQAGEWSSNEQ